MKRHTELGLSYLYQPAAPSPLFQFGTGSLCSSCNSGNLGAGPPKLLLLLQCAGNWACSQGPELRQEGQDAVQGQDLAPWSQRYSFTYNRNPRSKGRKQQGPRSHSRAEASETLYIINTHLESEHRAGTLNEGGAVGAGCTDWLCHFQVRRELRQVKSLGFTFFPTKQGQQQPYRTLWESNFWPTEAFTQCHHQVCYNPEENARVYTHTVIHSELDQRWASF